MSNNTWHERVNSYDLSITCRRITLLYFLQKYLVTFDIFLFFLPSPDTVPLTSLSFLYNVSYYYYRNQISLQQSIVVACSVLNLVHIREKIKIDILSIEKTKKSCINNSAMQEIVRNLNVNKEFYSIPYYT